MMNETYNEKKVIWESKPKQIASVFISFLFVAIVIWVGKYDTFIFWLTILLFGVGGIFMLARLLNPNNLFVTYNSKLGKQILFEYDNKFRNDYGNFEYVESGFNITIGLERKYYRWNEIEKVYSYKKDLLAYDEICLDIYTSNNDFFTITEESPGWSQFITRLSKNIVSIKEEWFFEIANPVFKKNLTLLYDKKTTIERK